jgi:hypothetical protein
MLNKFPHLSRSTERQIFIGIIIFLLLILTLVTGKKTNPTNQEQSLTPSKISSSPLSSPQPTPEAELLPPLTEPIQQSETKNTEITHHPGWRTYKDYGQEIRFEYPPHLLVIADDKKTQLLNPDTLNLDNATPIILLEISDDFKPLAYDSIRTPEEAITADLAPVTIDGQKYPFSRFILGEGSTCGGGTRYTYTIRLPKYNLFIFKDKSIKMCDDLGNELNKNKYLQVETKASDLEYARQVLETISPIN